jgi:site-specific DNA-methyltransferase (adenine-specific)
MIITGDCLEEMRKMESNSISAVVTDPPYGLSFMGKGWDKAVPGPEYWKECLRITKPGGYLLAMGGTRTYHRLTCAIEDAGYEIRDCLMWIYGSGFPKSHNNFGIEGYGTALKPAYEPIIMAMKSPEGTFAQNTKKWGQAGINIDGSRIPTSERLSIGSGKRDLYEGGFKAYCSNAQNPLGRWPANVLLDEEASRILDEQSGVSKSNNTPRNNSPRRGCSMGREYERVSVGHDDFGGASRFFYCAKASANERNRGCDNLTPGADDWLRETSTISDSVNLKQNHHPTVKPLKLMEYLIKLVMPPKDGLLLDPFAGSGTTILAAKRLGFEAIGIEKNANYAQIARARLESYVEEPKEKDLVDMAIEKSA